jgi:hypothetical protein
VGARGLATPLLFRAAGEFWNEYLVDDGSVLRLKIVVTEVNRLEGEYDDEGQPVYAVKSVNAMRVSGRSGSWSRRGLLLYPGGARPAALVGGRRRR